MPRYLVEREFVDDFGSFLAGTAVDVITRSYEDAAVTWLCSYVSDDGRRIFCLLEASGPEAIRRAARWAGMPGGVLRRVSVLGPYVYSA